MKYIDFRSIFKSNLVISKSSIFTYFPKFDDKNLVYWQKKGYLKKVINGFYVFSDIELSLDTSYSVANNIYYPSYISSFQAFFYYGLIPEQVTYITSVSTKRSKVFSTDIGVFKYHNIKKELFWGYEVVVFKNQSFYMADLEKSILDFFYLNKNYRTRDDILGLRLNFDLLHDKLDEEKLLIYLKLFDTKVLEKTIFILLKLLKNA